ncbi:CHAT domain-containing protein [Suillus subluteus]|nr:CHAT domain-containing protein [Suillus subluteus]
MLETRFKRRGSDEDLDQAIAFHGETLALHPLGDNTDLDQAIALHREALTLRPVSHTDQSESLNNLAGNNEDLDQAIALQREALAFNLAIQLSIHFEHRGNDKDLDQAIALNREALALRPVSHIDRSLSLSNLANQLSIRFEHRGNNKDLDQAIALQREVLALHPVGHRDRSRSLNNLANQLSTHFHHRGSNEDLDQAIALHREALALRPLGHTDWSKSLNSLVNWLSTRFYHRGNDEDLDQAITLYREGLALRPALGILSNRLSTRFEHRGNNEDLNQAIALQREVPALCPVGNKEDLDESRENLHWLDGTGAGEDSDSLLARLQASLRWVHCAHQYSHDTELEAYATSMRLLDAYMTMIASASSRHNIMEDFPDTLAVDAASCALHRGDVCRAVELLEQGRTIIWTQMTRLRMPLDSLQTHGDHAAALMKKFRDLSSLLDKPLVNYPEANPRVDVESEENRYRRLVKDWNRAVEEIRKIEGFSHVLLPPLFSDLQDAARDGLIIMLIASKSSCNAIIIPHQQPPTSIQLPINLEKLLKLVLALQEALEKEASPRGNQPALIKALRKLWGDVVRPVVENLGGFAPQESLLQQYISSYTPSLTALMKARRSHDRSLSVSFTAIGQNLPTGHSSTLDFVEPELELVWSLLPHPPTVSFTKITSIDAMKWRALCALQDNTWLHFACHGTQKYDEPFKSAFLMCDHPLSLLDITQMNLSRHQFAFLSACETAVGDFSTPDEVIHLAAGLQFAGVNSVVGTLWKVNDSTVQRLVEAFYKNLCGDGTMNSKRAARALHRAVQSLACDKDMPLDQCIVFIHIGI